VVMYTCASLCLHVAMAAGCQGAISRRNADGHQVSIMNHHLLYDTAPGLSFCQIKC